MFGDVREEAVPTGLGLLFPICRAGPLNSPGLRPFCKRLVQNQYPPSLRFINSALPFWAGAPCARFETASGLPPAADSGNLPGQ